MYTLIAFKPNHVVYCGGGDYITFHATCIREDYETREQIIARVVELKTVQQMRKHKYGKDFDCVIEDFWIFSGEPEIDIIFDAFDAVEEWRRINKPEKWAKEQQELKEMNIRSSKILADWQEKMNRNAK